LLSFRFFAQMPISLQIQSRRELSNKADELLRFAQRARTAVRLRGTVSILIESNERMQALNRHFRQKDKPTDVLSFSAAPAVQRIHAGDIAISADIATANARSLGHSVADEIKILILHGMLHLAGHDHENDSGHMARLEKRLRAQLMLPSSLTERALTERTSVGKPLVKTKRVSRRKPARIKTGHVPAKGARKGVRAKSVPST
jgi:probable rRNA maturation factor